MSIKRIAKNFLLSLVSNDAGWRVIQASGLGTNKLLGELRRYHVSQEEMAGIIGRIQKRIEARGMNVIEGPFAGMHYPRFVSRGSTLVPKLLGTYEKELHPVISLFVEVKFPIIVDVGCAEGYYAVGLARRCKEAKVLAYDTDRFARRLCMSMAASNGVEDRLSVYGTCTPQSLMTLDFSCGGLVVADCEGYEEVLFNQDTAKHLRNAHIIVELHETCAIGIKEKITNLFKATHDIQFIQSLPDEVKAKTYKSDVVSDTDMQERMVAFAEGRPVIMDWAVMIPHSKTTDHQ